MLSARGLAHGDSDASAVLGTLDLELARITGVDVPTWPALFGRRRSRVAPRGGGVRTLELPRIAPSQHLLCTGGIADASVVSRALAPLLEAGFGATASSPMSDETRARLCAEALPADLCAAWRRGLGLEPPGVLVPPRQVAAGRLFATMFANPLRAAAVAPEIFEGLAVADAVDLTMSALSLRATLRAAGDLPVPKATLEQAA